MTVKTSMSDKACEVAQFITGAAINGLGPISPADKVAEQFLRDARYPTRDACANSIIRWHCARNFGSGFVTSLGGVLTLPAAIPAALGASCVIQARMSAAIAYIYDYDLEDDRVQTFVLLTLVGSSIDTILKDAGVEIAQKATLALIKRIPGDVIKAINKKVGFRLITIAGEKGVINLTKLVPVVGGVAGGTVDSAWCYGVGKTAKSCFRREDWQLAPAAR